MPPVPIAEHTPVISKLVWATRRYFKKVPLGQKFWNATKKLIVQVLPHQHFDKCFTSVYLNICFASLAHVLMNSVCMCTCNCVCVRVIVYVYV